LQWFTIGAHNSDPVSVPMSLLITYASDAPYPAVVALEAIRRRDVVPHDKMALIAKDRRVVDQLIESDNAGQLGLFLMTVDWNTLAGALHARLPAHAVALSGF
jgi:hypothetical protein